MRFFGKPEGEATLTEAEQAERAMTMQSLRTDVEGGQGSSTRNAKYGKIVARMAKYQDFARIKFKPKR